MALQIRRGTAAEVSSNSFAPAIGEPLYVTDEQRLYIGDGATEKGNAIGGVNDIDQLTSVSLITESIGTISSYSVSSNVATVNLALAKGYTVGLSVTIADTTVSALNNTHVITAIPSANQFSFALTNPDVANTTITGTVTPQIKDGDVLYWDAGANTWENHSLELEDLSDIDFTTAPTTDDVLKYDGTSFVPGGIDIVGDTSPQLGGHLDTNNFSITSLGTNDINLDPGTGQNVVIRGNTTDGSGRLVLNCEQNSHGITIKGPPHSAAANYTLTLPNTDGNSGELLATDGSGVLSWSTIDLPYTQFKYNLASAPTGAVSNSQILGVQTSIGDWDELTFANNTTNGTNLASASSDPTLTGISVITGLFTEFPQGVYRVDATLEITIDNLATNSYFAFDHELQARNGATIISNVTQNFNFTTVGTAPSAAITQDVAMSFVVNLDNATASSNQIRINLDGDQSNDYYCSNAFVRFTKIG